jgi:hypothetical protein
MKFKLFVFLVKNTGGSIHRCFTNQPKIAQKLYTTEKFVALPVMGRPRI